MRERRWETTVGGGRSSRAAPVPRCDLLDHRRMNQDIVPPAIIEMLRTSGLDYEVMPCDPELVAARDARRAKQRSCN